MPRNTEESRAGLSKPLHFGMLVCCAIMVAPLAVFFLRGGTVAGLQDSIGVLAPILVCLAAHGAMFLIMGKSCHSRKEVAEDSAEPNPSAARVASTDA